MTWFLLLLIVVTGIFINSFRLFFLGLLVIAIKAFPLVMLPSIGAVIVWTIKTSLRR